MSEHHARLLTRIYRHLISAEERLPADWVAEQVGRLDRTDGDIDTLVARIAHIRTWTYITHRPGWLGDGGHWQDRARAIEDKLSDALHDRITQRFVDRRAALLVRHLQDMRELYTTVTEAGEVRVEGQFVGEIHGFRFQPDPAAGAARPLAIAANRALPAEIAQRARRLAAADDAAFALEPNGQVTWQGAPVARLAAGPSPLTPRVELLPADFLEGGPRDEVRRRLDRFVRGRIDRVLAPLPRLLERPADMDALGPAARGLVFRLGEALGTLDAETAAPLLEGLPAGDRKALTRAGIRFGTLTIYIDALLKPAAVALRGLLWAVHRGRPLPAPLPPPGRLSVAAAPGLGDAVGYRIVGPRAIRVDRLERLAAALRAMSREGGFVAEGGLAAMIGTPLAELPAVIVALGYRATPDAAGNPAAATFAATPRRRGHGRPKSPRPLLTAPTSDHPFARLRDLELAK